jgi:hypothetical protein
VGIGFVGFGAGVWFLSTFKPGDVMNKIDLIIENIEYAKLVNVQAHRDELLEEALTAARELKALKPVGVFQKDSLDGWLEVWPEYGGTKLYALDEVTK